MTPGPGIFLLIFTGMIVLFLTARIPIDLTALVGLCLFTICGFLTPSEAFSGFSSQAVVLMVASFFVSGALRLTGVGDRLAQKLVAIAGNSELRCVALIVFVAASISSVMNNVAATAVMLPAVGGIAKRTGVAPSRLFMPLSFGVLLGGTTTLIGTSSNLLVSEMVINQGFRPFGFLDFFPIGIALVICGGLYIILIGRTLLPGKKKEDDGGSASLTDVYRLNERMFALKIPPGSSLGGRTLESIHFAEVLGADVMAIQRGAATIRTPGAHDVMQSGDTLIVRGRIGELQALFRISGSQIESVAAAEAGGLSIPIQGVNIRVTKTMLAHGKTIKELGFRASSGLHVIAIDRNGVIIHSDVAHAKLEEGDVLRTVGPRAVVERLGTNYEVVKTVDVSSMSSEAVFLLKLPTKSGLEAVKIRDSRMHELLGLTVIGIIRAKEVMLGLSGDALIQSGDTLLVAGRASVAEQLAELSTLAVEEQVSGFQLESPETGVIEIVLSPRSKLIGKSLEEVSFTDRYGFRVIAIWRDGEPKRTRFAKLPLKFGDALLLQGPRGRMHLFGRDPDFVLLSTEYQRPIRSDAAKWALFSLAVLTVLSVFNLEPPHVAAVVAAIIAVLGGAIRMDEAYREIEWRVVIIVACLIPVGMIFQRLGFAEHVSSLLMSRRAYLGEAGILLILAVGSSVLSQALDSSITVVVLSPIAISLAKSAGYIPHPFLLAVAFGASIAFLTPFSHRAHLLIMSPGGYRARDFARIGWGLSVICLAIIVLGCYLGLGRI